MFFDYGLDGLRVSLPDMIIRKATARQEMERKWAEWKGGGELWK